jgi:hypothetical protein
VITFPLGTALQGIKKIVLEPSILPPTPWANHPNSFAAALFQKGNVVSSWMRWRYSRLAPVSSLITALTMGMGLGGCVKGIAIVSLFVNAMGRKMRGARNRALLADCWRALALVLYLGRDGVFIYSSSNVSNKFIPAMPCGI